MAVVSLDKFRSGLESKHSSTTIPLPSGSVAVLRNALRMPKAERKALNDAFEAWRERFPSDAKGEEGSEAKRAAAEPDRPTPQEEDICAHLANVITLLIGNRQTSEELLNTDLGGQSLPLRDDIAALDYIMELHAGVDLGEA